MRIKNYLLVAVLGIVIFWPVKMVRAVDTLKLYFDNSNLDLKVGEKKTVRLMADSGNVYLSAIDLALSYNGMIKINNVAVNKTNFATIQSEKTSGGQILMIAYNMGKFTNQLPKGAVEIATIEAEGVSVGPGILSLDKSQMVGNDGSNTNMFYFNVSYTKPTITVLTNEVVPTTAPIKTPTAVPTATPIVENGRDGILKFRTTFSGVVAGAQCANNWPLSVVVVEKNGNSKTYSNVATVAEGEDNGKIVYKSEVLLTGISTKDNLAVFVKGPRHMQVKYGVNGQSNFYNQPGGNIIVDTNSNDTTVYDFTKYSLMAGDVNQDGEVNGLDFSVVKGDVNNRSEGQDMVSDLNGNCKLESQDLAQLMVSMKDKQEQLY